VAASSASVVASSSSTGNPCPRRPFLVASRPRAGALVARSDWTAPAAPGAIELDARTARALAEAWLEDGRQEHASIAAFARFTMLALAVGAPPEFAQGSQGASLDEIAHANGCLALARRYGAGDVGPGPVSLAGAMPEQDAALADLAALTVHEGCVGETLGVLLATEQLSTATDPEVRALLERIVRDEQRHAELAWRFVRWAIERGGEEVRRAVAAAFDEAMAETRALDYPPDPGCDLQAFAAHGRLTRARTASMVERGLREIVEPCAKVLLEGAPRSGSSDARVALARGDGLTS
jgi:hypothetical protein